MQRALFQIILATLLALAACHTPPKPVVAIPAPPRIPSPAPQPPAKKFFHDEKLAAMDALIAQAIAEKKLPGGVLWIERGSVVHSKSFGHRALVPQAEPMSPDTLFDAASLTKVIATTPAIGLLLEQGCLKLDAPVRDSLPEFTGEGRERVTLRHLLTHTSGLRPGLGLVPEWQGAEKALQLACAEKLQAPPGTQFVYSDINFILLGEIVRRVSGEPLDLFAARTIFGPLKMRDTTFLPSAGTRPRIAPTTATNGIYLRGEVHDPTARRMRGVAGHAGLFTTAADLARFARMLLHGGELEGVRVFRPETIGLMTSVQSPGAVTARRGLGWDIDSPYSGPRGRLFPVGSFGHTGWTGTSLWLDPFSRTFVILLSNRNHPDGGNVVALRSQLGTLAAEAVADFDFENVPGALPRRP
jgi:CubicO group peptidase (beta-lactamase class C family)